MSGSHFEQAQIAGDQWRLERVHLLHEAVDQRAARILHLRIRVRDPCNTVRQEETTQ